MINNFISYIFHYLKENYFYLLLLLISFLSYLKTGKLPNGGKSTNMIYKTEKDLFLQAKAGQDFTGTHLVKSWRINSAGNLEETGELIDIDELIQSNRDTCLANVLAKFTEIEQGISKVDNENVSTYAGMQDDLIELGELMERGEALRDKYKLGDKLSTKEVFDYVSKQSKDLNTKILAEQEKLKAVKTFLDNGGKDNEKKNVEESK